MLKKGRVSSHFPTSKTRFHQGWKAPLLLAGLGLAHELNKRAELLLLVKRDFLLVRNQTEKVVRNRRHAHAAFRYVLRLSILDGLNGAHIDLCSLLRQTE